MFYIQQFHFSPHLSQVSADVIDDQTRTHRTLIERGLVECVLKPLPESLIFTLISGQVFGTYQYVTDLPADEQQSAISQSCELLWGMLTR